MLMVSMLSGCVSWKDAESLTDTQLCERVGSSSYANKVSTRSKAIKEIERRDASGLFSLSVDDCKELALAEYEHQQSVDRFVAAMGEASSALAEQENQQLQNHQQQMNQMNQMQTTTCHQQGIYTVCNTF